MPPSLTQPLVFEPLFMERVWGGRELERVFGKKLPPGKRIGESWEIVDRPEAQSVVRQGPWCGHTLHELWCAEREGIFGSDLPDTPRFPILAKLLDATERLSLQVHPPAAVASSLGVEPKSELWYFAATSKGAEIFAGLRPGVERKQLEAAVRGGEVAELMHRIEVKPGDSFFIPSGRLHGVGGGNLIVEIQQNSDTTYRVFDWDRTTDDGLPRPLHIEESLQSIRADDYAPECLRPNSELLLQCPHFAVDKWDLDGERRALDQPAFAILICLSGSLECAGTKFVAGDFWILPAGAEEVQLRPLNSGTALLRVTLPLDPQSRQPTGRLRA